MMTSLIYHFQVLLQWIHILSSLPSSSLITFLPKHHSQQEYQLFLVLLSPLLF